MSYLLDTCIISRLRKIKNEPNLQLKEWFLSHPEKDYFLSVLTIGEIQAGISKLNEQNKDEAKKKMIFEDWLMSELIPRFKDRIFPIDEHTCSVWGVMKGNANKLHRTLPVVDSLIAATAIQHNLTLVTENTKDFLFTGVRLYNPLDL